MEAPHARAQAAAPSGGIRRKAAAAATREWLVVSPSGGACLEEVGKHQVMARTGLPARDLRVLDPHLSYPSSILGRERAIVVNLERFRAVITAHEVLIPNSKDPVVASFVRELQARVSDSSGGNHMCDIDGETLVKEASGWPGNGVPGAGQRDVPGASKTNSSAPTGENNRAPAPPPLALCKDQSMKKVLPFEFRALEVCLESACRCLEAETLTLEQEAYPALDELTSKISTLNLERVRQIKSRLVAISGRVQKKMVSYLEQSVEVLMAYGTLTPHLLGRAATVPASKLTDLARFLRQLHAVWRSVLVDAFEFRLWTPLQQLADGEP